MWINLVEVSAFVSYLCFMNITFFFYLVLSLIWNSTNEFVYTITHAIILQNNLLWACRKRRKDFSVSKCNVSVGDVSQRAYNTLAQFQQVTVGLTGDFLLAASRREEVAVHLRSRMLVTSWVKNAYDDFFRTLKDYPYRG